MKSARNLWLVVSLALAAMPSTTEARVVRLTVERTRPFAEGKSFGAAGPYVRMEGTAFFEVDPNDPLNALIVNLDKAPKTAKGMVEFRTQFVIIRPVPVPNNVRLYSLSSHSHGGASGVAALPTAKGICEYPTNGASSYNTVVRAMLVTLDEWADRGVAPPKNRYADVRDGTLVTVEEAARSFPNIPGARFPTKANRLTLLDFGPKFTATGGWLSRLPPARGVDYRVLVPKPDKDGLDAGGVRTVDVAVPVGTNTGWNRIAGPRSRDLYV